MRRAVLLVAAVVLLAACGTSDTSEFTGTRLDSPYDVPGISLTDTDSKPYSLADDTDKPLTLVFFGYTHCPDYCPAVMGSIAASMNRLSDEEREQVDMVFVTTDPQRDDEAALRAYLDGYDRDFLGLTGDLDDVVALAKPLHVYVSDGEELPSGGRDLGGHTTATLAIDENDQAIALWKQDTSAVEYAADIQTLLDD